MRNQSKQLLSSSFMCCFIREEDFSAGLILEKMAEYKTQFYMCGHNHFTAISMEKPGKHDLSR